MKTRTFVCWALRDGDTLFYQGWGYPQLYATQDEAEKDIRNPHLNAIQVEVVVRETQPPKPLSRGCNRHEDCEKANAEWRERHPGENYPPPSFHCHDECCEECFGN